MKASMNDRELVLRVLAAAIKRSPYKREAIAARMTELLGRTVTGKMLDAFTAESRDDRRFPCEFERAFCEATGDNTLLRCRAELAGFKVIDGDDLLALEIGRAYLLKDHAESRIATALAAKSGVQL